MEIWAYNQLRDVENSLDKAIICTQDTTTLHPKDLRLQDQIFWNIKIKSATHLEVHRLLICLSISSSLRASIWQVWVHDQCDGYHRITANMWL